MVLDQVARDVMTRLKEETAELHKEAEQRDFQRALLQGTISRDDYIRWLGQMRHVHGALERRLKSASKTNGAIAAVVKGYQYSEPYLIDDLRFFGVEPESIAPLAATIESVARINDESITPAELLGRHYVLEGSKNGSRFIAAAVGKALGLSPPPRGRGMTYLDPYGAEQRPRWQQFRTDMNAAGFSPEECEHLVLGAKDMFREIGRINDELAPRSGGVAALRPR